MEEAKYSYELLPEEHNVVFEGCKQAIGRHIGFKYVESLQSFTPDPDDFEYFDADFENVWGVDRTPESTLIAHRLYIGMRIAAAAFTNKLLQNQPSELKYDRFDTEKKEVFSKKDDLESTCSAIFSDPNIQKRAFMASGIKDERAAQINLERIALRILFDSGCMLEDIDSKIEEQELTQAARTYIKDNYFSRENAHISDLTFNVFSSQTISNKDEGELSEDKLAEIDTENNIFQRIDEMYMDRLPEWILAAATPIQDGAFEHLFSPAWKKD